MVTKIKIRIKTRDKKFSSKETTKIQIEILQVQSISSTCSMRWKEIVNKSQSHDSLSEEHCRVPRTNASDNVILFFILTNKTS